MTGSIMHERADQDNAVTAAPRPIVRDIVTESWGRSDKAPHMVPNFVQGMSNFCLTSAFLVSRSKFTGDG